ncbi:Mannan polymerase II complex ANP1 subunit [Lachancea thermotolerans]|uniref:KLTH0C03432p n=1 Tax=Lachancea thermotolerans (strain ATCC 56472 / CBS 6340 / NRRL Y-8284) TaxID=559295 RepID=C5DDS6_LACTC|nr:KLTH0C03432p [Lachancea thermotolerans CBS 6340]CAR21937.1 KLTH0C03432p [Lachancea thermotolerans CBS 6340]
MKYTTQASIAGLVLTAFLLVRLLLGNYSAIRLAWPPLVVFKAYVPSFENVPNVQYYDLRNYQGHADGWQRGDHVLFTVPLRDAAEHLPMFFDHMDRISYPHNLIDLSFLVSDSSDDTMGVLLEYLQKAQSKPDRTQRFGNIEIYEKDFGQAIGQSFSDRHGFAAQGPRRKLMGRARNWLGSVALKPYHSWVYWRDVDVETIPPTILEDLMHHDRDVIVPNVWRPLPDWLGNIQPYDLNSWQESEGGLQLAESLDEDSVIVEGYPEYATWRTHLAYMRDPSGDPEDEMELDGIGGVSILSKAKVFRAGSHFPAFSFEKHAETEAFGKLSRRLGYSVVGLPHYVIWHIYEPSSDDLKHMAWMAEEEKRKIEENKIREFYDRVWQVAFDDVRDDWEMERLQVMKNIDPNVLDRRIVVDWDDDEAEDESQGAAKKDSDSSKEAPKEPADKAGGNPGAQEDTKGNTDEGKAAGADKNLKNRPQGVEQLDFNPDS